MSIQMSKPSAQDPERGAAMITAIIAVTLLAAMSASLLSFSVASVREVGATHDSGRALVMFHSSSECIWIHRQTEFLIIRPSTHFELWRRCLLRSQHQLDAINTMLFLHNAFISFFHFSTVVRDSWGNLLSNP